MFGYRIIFAFGKLSVIWNSRYIVYILSNPTCENIHVYSYAWKPVLCSTFFNILQTSLTQCRDFYGLIYRYGSKMKIICVLRFRARHCIHVVSIRHFWRVFFFVAQLTQMSMLCAWFITRYKLLRDRLYSFTTYKEEIRKKYI